MSLSKALMKVDPWKRMGGSPAPQAAPNPVPKTQSSGTEEAAPGTPRPWNSPKGDNSDPNTLAPGDLGYMLMYVPNIQKHAVYQKTKSLQQRSVTEKGFVDPIWGGGGSGTGG